MTITYTMSSGRQYLVSFSDALELALDQYAHEKSVYRKSDKVSYRGMQYKNNPIKMIEDMSVINFDFIIQKSTKRYKPWQELEDTISYVSESYEYEITKQN